MFKENKFRVRNKVIVKSFKFVVLGYLGLLLSYIILKLIQMEIRVNLNKKVLHLDI